MKKLYMFVFLVLAAVWATGGARILLTWNPNPASERITNYVIEASVDGFESFVAMDVGNVTNVVLGIVNTNCDWLLPWTETSYEFCFRLLAENPVTYSDYSTNVCLVIPPTPPDGLFIIQLSQVGSVSIGFTNLPTLFRVEHSPDLEQWQGYLTMQVHDPYAWPSRFYWLQPVTNEVRQFWRLSPLQ